MTRTWLTGVALLPLLAVLAVWGALPAEATSWTDAVKAVVKDHSAAHADNKRESTDFFRDLSDLQAEVDDLQAGDKVQDKYSHLKKWLVKLRHLKKQYRENALGKAVVVGGGPLGLASALLLATKGKTVTVLEKSDGVDKRWNAIVMNGPIDLELTTKVLGLEVDWVGELPEMLYVFGASLKMIGVIVKYNTQFLQLCDGKDVHFRSTPHGDDDATRTLRNTYYTRAEVCHARKSPSEDSIRGVEVLVGAGGTNGPVRQAVADGEPGRVFTATYPEVATVAPRLVDVTADKNNRQGAPEAGLAPLRLREAGHESEPLLTHVIVSFKKLDGGVELGEMKSARVSQQKMCARAAPSDSIEAMLRGGGGGGGGENAQLVDNANNRRGRQPPPNDNQAAADLDYASIVGSEIPHKMTYVDKEGKSGVRYYLEFLLRHTASKTFRAEYKAIGRDDMEGLVKQARGEAQPFGNGELAPTKEEVGRKLMSTIRKITFASSPSLKALFGATDDARTTAFNAQLEHVKVFDQHLRGAATPAILKPDGLKIILVGDSARDSYYAHGNSVNSAYEALHNHMDAMLKKKSGPSEAAAYRQEVVTDFVDFIGGDIYFRTFCGCEVAGFETHLRLSDVTCRLRDRAKFTTKKRKIGFNTKKQCDILSARAPDTKTKFHCSFGKWKGLLRNLAGICDAP